MRTFADSNPIAATIYFLTVSGIAMFAANPVISAISLIGAVVLFVMNNGRKSVSTHLFSAALFAVMALLNPLVSHNGATVLFVMNNNPVTLEALIYGICSALTVVAVLYWFHSFSQIMTSDKLLYLFGALSPKLALTLSMALRYVPLFGTQIKKTHASQKALGLYKDDNIVDSFKGGMRIFSVMITWALENGIITADSMTARGYGMGKRSRFSLFRFKAEDIFLICAAVVFSVLSIYGIIGAEFEFYPYISVPAVTARLAVGYASYGVMILLPVIIGVKEELKWKYLKSKI
ncbi:MAG: energy-coupling factor transporter transmembrane protein EcfT [Oscillospiraceae bacterium]|nr:energy-coupling factor transporter transmembrane protein EcfT [Oscillospiraceae bacterium]